MSNGLKKRLCLLFLMTSALVFSGGCTSAETKAYNATATIRIKDLPDSYYDIDKKVRKSFLVRLSFDRTDAKASEDIPDVDLKASNDFTGKIYLEPGSYSVRHTYVYPDEVAPFTVNQSSVPSFTVSRNNNTVVDVPVTDIPVYETAKEMLDAPAFSHKVQVNDTVYDMESLSGAFSFNMTKPEKLKIAGKEYNAFSCTGAYGLSILTNSVDASNTPVGIRITRKNVKLWDGITVGEKAVDISRTKNGLKNHLAFCKGSPILGLGFHDTDFVYMGDDSNDKLDLFTEGNNGIVYAVNYLYK